MFCKSRFSAVLQESTKLLVAFNSLSVWKPALFLLLWQALPNLDVAMHYFQMQHLSLPAIRTREMDFTVKLSTAAGLLLFDYGFNHLSMDRVFSRVLLLSALLALPSLFLAHHYTSTLVASPDVLETQQTTVDQMHRLVHLERVARSNGNEFRYRAALLLAAEICHANAEPAFYALLMALMNVGESLQVVIVSFLLHLFGIHQHAFESTLYYSIVTLVFSFSFFFLIPRLLLFEK